MTNEQKYKTAEERTNEFKKFCKNMQCSACPYKGGFIVRCSMNWLADEYKDTKQDLPFMTEGNNVLSVRDKELMVAFFGRKCAKEVCDSLNATALAWHKRMMEKEGK